MQRVLAIETSCDETAAAVVEFHQSSIGNQNSIVVLSSIVSSQIDIHKITGGVVPEVAARAHVEAIVPVISEAVKQARITKEQIDAIATTTRPGLRPALVVGETAGRALAVAWGKPFVSVHHIAGHIAASWLLDDGESTPNLRDSECLMAAPALPWKREGDAIPPLIKGRRGGVLSVTHQFPAVVLVVSGGHTQLFRLNEKLELKLLGQTRDDAAGEAFDKIARLLELPYPGGPELAKLALQGNEKAFDFPRPMLNTDNLDFSFSGLKTAVYYAIRDKKLSLQEKADVAASAQNAIVDILVQKTLKAVQQESAQEVIIAGGVAANTKLRETMKVALGDTPLVVPPIKYCTDNAAMIGVAVLLGIAMPGA
ncbi:MAG: tRNA (adenosine(37)-N6)-threonylcarbamoyltransferase complex transferase subunit TsaD [bacterium]|nr:tRNA (adenosine(37)-N6)-threonylcarbamoyltransferase complex transferase subunit TsaD [bacterium]